MAVRRIQPNPDDAETPAWADPALQRLGEWLIEQGIAREDAESVQESIWAWYSYFVLPAYRRTVPLAIACKRARISLVCFRLPVLTLSDIADTNAQQLRAAMEEAFQFRVAGRHASIIDARLDALESGSIDDFDVHVQHWYSKRRLDVIGIFHDNLRNELAAIMEPRSFDAWLATPNLALAGAKPGDLLASGNDRPLRDLILSVRHALPLWI